MLRDERQDDGPGCCSCGCIGLGLLLLLAGAWWGFIPIVIGGMIYSLASESKEPKRK